MANDPEAHTTQSGLSRSNFKVAVQRSYKNANGTYDADFLPVVAWRQTADFANKYLKKGYRVAVSGSIQTRSYDAQDGSKRYMTEIIADHVENLEPRDSQRQQAAPQAQQGKDEFVEMDVGDDLPF